MTRRGQSLVELAIVLPLLVLLALGGVQFVRLAIARSGLDAATAAGASAAARATSATTAATAGRLAFTSIATGYGLGSTARVTIDAGSFLRGGTVTATGTAPIALGQTGVPALRVNWLLTSTATARIEDWRSRPPGS